MGMDLYSVRKPRGKNNYYFRFNWTGWRNVCDFLDQLEIDLSEFSGSNDGDIVSPETCEEVADRIEDSFNKGHIYMSFGLMQKVYSESGDHKLESKQCYHILGLKDIIVNPDQKDRDYWLVNFKTQTVDRPTLKVKPIEDLLELNRDELPIELAKYPIELINESKQIWGQIPVELRIIEARLSNQEFKLEPQINWETWSSDYTTMHALGKSRNSLAYYLEFAKFCRNCSKTKGFRQC